MFIAVLLSLGVVSGRRTSAKYFYNTQRPLIIAHRGASGYVPEHTLQAYDIASYMGADFIEPDLVPTKDFSLIINHENLLNETTNVESLPQFSHLHTTKTIPTYAGPVTETGWFSEDFTLSEIKELRAKQRLSFRPETLNFFFQKITINEALDWAIDQNKERISKNQTLLGVYIELKYPGYFNSLGFAVEDMLLKILKERGIDNIKGASETCPIILQCFELQSLQYMSKQTDLPLVYLINSAYPVFNMSYYVYYVDGVGPNNGAIFTPDGMITDFVHQAHGYGLAVHMWVVRDDVPFSGFNRPQTYQAVLKAKLDGIFDEFPDSASIYFSSFT